MGGLLRGGGGGGGGAKGMFPPTPSQITDFSPPTAHVVV